MRRVVGVTSAVVVACAGCAYHFGGDIVYWALKKRLVKLTDVEWFN